ncbi:tyrosine--tRNA ligase 1, cytoplasmic-like protein, partial [Tanacetum coccineum]
MGIPDVVRKIKDVGEGRLEKMKVDNSSKLFGVMKTINVNKMTSAGCKVKIWIADWFAQLNNKMGGDLKKIRVVGEYLIEIWKAAGMKLENVEFLWSSDEINSKAHEYWPLVMDIARRNNLARITRCCQIMGRNEKDDLTAAQIFYPCMQCADVFFLKADICQLGMDQRKVNVLAREYCDAIKRKNKPIILSHHMLPGLLEGQEKMSKSNSSSAVFMEDEEVERKEENGGAKVFANYEELVADYENGDLHPNDLKPALSKALNKILQPVRDHFKNDENAKALLKKVKEFSIISGGSAKLPPCSEVDNGTGDNNLPSSVITVLSNDDLLMEILLRLPFISLHLFKA